MIRYHLPKKRLSIVVFCGDAPQRQARKESYVLIAMILVMVPMSIWDVLHPLHERPECLTAVFYTLVFSLCVLMLRAMWREATVLSPGLTNDERLDLERWVQQSPLAAIVARDVESTGNVWRQHPLRFVRMLANPQDSLVRRLQRLGKTT